MRGIQTFCAMFFPKKAFAGMKAESMEWTFACDCGHEFSGWDTGGIRYKAAGNPVKSVRCPGCGVIAPRRLSRIHT